MFINSRSSVAHILLYLLLAPLLIACEDKKQKAVVKVQRELEGSGRILEHFPRNNQEAKLSMPFSVALPPGYDGTNISYAVVYFLHGSGGDEITDVFGFSNYLDGLLAQGRCSEHLPIIVFPTADATNYMGSRAGLIGERLVAFIDAKYNTLQRPERRMIAGFSIGGAAATRISLLHPGVFGLSVSWAGGVWGNDGKLFQSVQSHSKDFKDGALRLYLFNGDEDRPGSYASLTPVLKAHDIEFHKIVFKNQGHHLGDYYAKSKGVLGEDVCSTLGNY